MEKQQEILETLQRIEALLQAQLSRPAVTECCDDGPQIPDRAGWVVSANRLSAEHRFGKVWFEYGGWAARITEDPHPKPLLWGFVHGPKKPGEYENPEAAIAYIEGFWTPERQRAARTAFEEKLGKGIQDSELEIEVRE